MKIRIISFSKKTEPAIVQLEKEYLKRISRYAEVEILNLKREEISPQGRSSEKIRKEDERLEKAIPPHAYCIMLGEKGKELDSKEWAQFLDERTKEGRGMLCLVLGGPEGLSEQLEDKAHFRFSLSRLTFPHQLARLFLIESLYRSFDLLHGGNYHK